MNFGAHQSMDSVSETSSLPLHPPPPPTTALDIFPATLYRDTRFIKYNMFGNIVEVTPKYKPPIMRLGQGTYGVVYSAVNSETNEKVAIKKIADTFYNRIDAKRTLREIKLLRHMNHDNIVAIKDIIPPSRRNSFNDVYIVYEFMETDLHEVITSTALSSKHHQYFLYQILRGLKYIHSGNVLHRDLKPSNILLNLNCDLKIGDFGLARLSSESNAMTECVVTRWYRAPELLLNSSSYDSAIDVWSVGCIFMEMMLTKPLFRGRNHGEQLRLIIQLLGTPTEAEMESLNNRDATRYLRQLPFYPRWPLASYFPKMDPLAIDLAQKMLTFDPRRRITVEEALAHPYLELLHDASDEPVCTAQFDYGFVADTLTEAQAKEIIHMEAMAFNPQYYQPNL